MSQTHHTVDPKFTYFDKRARKDVVLYVGLLDAAHRAGLVAIETEILAYPCGENNETCIIRATAIFERDPDRPLRFTAIGDANPRNVGAAIAPHFIRMAETRAKARALRDALNIGMVTAEELGGADQTAEDDDGHAASQPRPQPAPARNTPPAFVTPKAAPAPAPEPPPTIVLTEDQEKTIAQAWEMAEASETYGATAALMRTLKIAATEEQWSEINRRWSAIRRKHYPQTTQAERPASYAG
jgi:hypothetical protein